MRSSKRRWNGAAVTWRPKKVPRLRKRSLTVALTDIILVGTPVRSVPPWMWYDSNTTLCKALSLVRDIKINPLDPFDVHVVLEVLLACCVHVFAVVLDFGSCPNSRFEIRSFCGRWEESRCSYCMPTTIGARNREHSFFLVRKAEEDDFYANGTYGW